MAKTRVAILFGGKSGEHEVSIVSACSIWKALDPAKYEVTMVGIAPDGRWTLPDPTALLQARDRAREIKLAEFPQSSGRLSPRLIGDAATAPMIGANDLGVDVVFPVLHGTNGEDGTVQGMLELAQVPYVGSGVLGSSVGMDKDLCKRVLRDAGIPVVPFLTLRKSEFESNPDRVLGEIEKRFGFPCFAKPANMGSSVGVHKIKSRESARAALEDAFSYDTKVLVEEAILARELEVSVLGNDQPRASVVGEIIPTHDFYSYEAKYLDENGAHLKIPAEGLSPEVMRSIQELAVRAFLAIECRGMARVDFFMAKDTGKIFVNELNTIPGFTSISMYPKLWAASGIAYPDLLDQLIQLALEQFRARKQLKTSWN